MTKLVRLALLALAFAAPVRAADAPAAKATLTSVGALLDAGYEIKSVVPISDADQKSIWPNDPVSPFSMVVLQKGTSLAACAVPTVSLVQVTPADMANTQMCHRR